jgi:bromodomain-containing protein 7/9
LTLVIPSLKSLKASQITTKKAKQLPSSISLSSSVYQDVDAQEKKPPRPVKLKPLKEVLAKLIAQIKRFDFFRRCVASQVPNSPNRKDDYAFFLTPVDISNVPGYTNRIKSPMDFGTMTIKVNRGKYRSLDDFTVSVNPIFQQIFNWSLLIFSQISNW